MINSKKLNIMEDTLFLNSTIIQINNILPINEELSLFDVLKDTSNTINESISFLLSESAINSQINKYQAKIKTIENQLKNNGIDLTEMNKLIKEKTNKIINFTKNVKDGKINREKMSEMISESFLDIFKDMTIKGVAGAILITLVIFIVHNLIFIFLSAYIATPGAAMAIVVIIISPIIEEIAKRISIKSGIAGEFLIVFNATEFLRGISRFYKFGKNLGKIILIKALPVFMHNFTMFVQHKFDKSDNDSTDENSNSKLGLLLGILVHGIWNFLSKINNSKISAWALK